MQNWVSVVMDAEGRFSVGYDAIQLGNVTDPATARIRASRATDVARSGLSVARPLARRQ